MCGTLLPGEQTLLLGTALSWGVPVGEGVRGCSSQGANQGVKPSSSWEDGPGRALLGPWPGLLVTLQGWLWQLLPVQSVSEKSVCVFCLLLMPQPSREGNAPRQNPPSQQEQQNPRQPKPRNTAGIRLTV